MNRQILRLAIPNIISNITIPILGMVDTAIAGRLGDPMVSIGALSIGATIFNFIYWNCSFIRMGTSGITAQHFGSKQFQECAETLIRSLLIGVIITVLILVLHRPIGEFSLKIMYGDALVAEYFYTRMWAIPAAIALFALTGWFIGMQDATTPMVIVILQNIINAIFSVWLAINQGFGIAGIAWGTVIAQWSGLLIAVIAIALRYRQMFHGVSFANSLSLKPLVEFVRVNADMFIRSGVLVVIYTFFSAASARMGDPAILAVNSLFINQLFMLYSYIIDGVAYAAISLTGRFIGERNHVDMQRMVRRTMFMGFVTALLFVMVYLVGWQQLLSIFIDSSSTDKGTLMERAREYILWVVVMPVAGFAPFVLDGIMIGGTLSRVLRNSMIGAAVVFFALYYSLRGWLGNDALWVAFVTFIVARGVLQYAMTRGLNALYDKCR